MPSLYHLAFSFTEATVRDCAESLVYQVGSLSDINTTKTTASSLCDAATVLRLLSLAPEVGRHRNVLVTAALEIQAAVLLTVLFAIPSFILFN